MLENYLIGFKQELEAVDRMIKKDKVPHALLLWGPESIGKRRLARIIAAKIILTNFTEKKSEFSSLTYASILNQVKSGNYPDLYLIDEGENKSNIIKDQIDLIRNSLSLKPYYPLGSITIINEAEKMSSAAANSFLKTLEEPGEGQYFILICSNLNFLPETIKSRTQMISCRRHSSEDLRQILNYIVAGDGANKQIRTALLDNLEGTLNDLDLSSEVNSISLEAKNPSKIELKIQVSLAQIEDLSRRVEDIFSSSCHLERKSQLIQFLRASGKNEAELDLKFRLLQKQIRKSMWAEDQESSPYWHELLTKLCEVIQTTKSRHLDPELQIGALI